MTSADSCQLSRTSQCGLPGYLAYLGRPPRVRSVDFPSIHPPHILSAAFGSKDFALVRKLIQLLLASYAVPVRRTGGLPPASFGFRLTADTLALS